MKSRDKYKFGALQELGGRFDHTGKADLTTSAIEVTKYAVDAMREWAKEEAGVTPGPAQILESAGVAIDAAAPAVTLTPQQARDVEIYRSAKQVAGEMGKVLSIAADDGAN
jgi:hypothetical protein